MPVAENHILQIRQINPELAGILDKYPRLARVEKESMTVFFDKKGEAMLGFESQMLPLAVFDQGRNFQCHISFLLFIDYFSLTVLH
jgi:hypothetical protein